MQKIVLSGDTLGGLLKLWFTAISYKQSRGLSDPPL